MIKETVGTAGAILICLTLLALGSCSGPVVTAVGRSDDLVIIGDEGERGIAELAVSTMESEVDWLVNEPTFTTTLTTPQSAGDLRNRRHVLLVGTWDRGAVRDLARKHFRGLREDAPPDLHLAEDIWARGQVVGLIIGKDRDDVLTYLTQRGSDAVSAFEAASIARLTRNLTETAEKAGVAGSLQERFGWSLSPPSGYDFFTSGAEDGFVFFRRTRPDRSIFVYWQNGDPEYVSEQYVVAKRQELAARYYDGDEIEWRRQLNVEQVEFLGRSAVRISGWWGNRELVGGGPFRSYCFHEPTQGRVYVVDVSLFAPGLEKVPLMRNLDATAHTFRVST